MPHDRIRFVRPEKKVEVMAGGEVPELSETNVHQAEQPAKQCAKRKPVDAELNCHEQGIGVVHEDGRDGEIIRQRVLGLNRGWNERKGDWGQERGEE